MAEKVLLVSVEPPETRIAEVRNGKLFDFNIERNRYALGDIFRGKVRDIVPGMNTAFIDIGSAYNALLYASDIVHSESFISKRQAKPIGELVKPGDEITVQIARPSVGNKGARVTNKISVSGRFSVVRSGRNNIGVSKKITDKKERARLRIIAEKLRPHNKSLIMRSQACGSNESDITRDANWAIQQLDSILKRAQKANAPSIISRAPGILGKFIRDQLDDSVTRIFIDNQEEYENCRALAEHLAPEFADRISFYNDAIPLFQRYELQKDLENMKKRHVPLPRGGTLVIDEAEALCAIDVNTARFTGKKQFADTVLTTNLAAAREACRQLRLRNIGGIIVIDFIDMASRDDREKVLLELQKAIKEDYTRTNIVQVSPSGLVELSRQRKSVSMRHLRRKNCDFCGGDGMISTPTTIAIEARRQLRILAQRDGAKTAMITLHPSAACAMVENAERWLIDLEESAKIKIALRANAFYAPAAIDIRRISLPATAADIEIGAQITIPPHSVIYSNSGIHYLLYREMLIRLDHFSFDGKAKPAIIEITNYNQHLYCARILVIHENIEIKST